MVVTVFFRNKDKKSAREEKITNFLIDEQIPYIEKNIYQLQREELMTMLKYTENGFDDLSGSVKNRADVTTNQMLELIRTGEFKVKTPIAIEGERTLIGYSDEQARVFIPKERRRVEALTNAAIAAEMFGLDSEEFESQSLHDLAMGA